MGVNTHKTTQSKYRDDISNTQPSITFLEVFVAVVASLTFFCVGTIRAWTSPGIYSMQTAVKDIKLEPNDDTWIASCIPLGAFIGTIVAAGLLQFGGRQKTILILSVPYITGWLLIGLSVNMIMILVGRILTGVAVGLSTAAASLYVSECSRPSVRGKLGLMPATLLALGIVVGFGVSNWTYWRTSALSLTAFPAALLLAAMFLPESPPWLLMCNRVNDARQSLRRLRGAGQDAAVEQELTECLTSLEENNKAKESFCDMMKKREIWSPLLLVFALMMFQQLSGISVVIYYLKIILNETKNHSDRHNVVLPIETNMSIIIFGGSHVLAFLISIPLIDRYGRKLLLVLSAILMSVSHIALGIFFYFGSYNYANLIINTGAWLPLTALCGYIAAYSIGFASVPYIIMSEVFPSRSRSYLCSIATLNEQIFCFSVVRIFPPLMKAVEPYIIFWLFALFCIISIVFVIFVVPETKGKSLAELETLFKKPLKSDIEPDNFVTIVATAPISPPVFSEFNYVSYKT